MSDVARTEDMSFTALIVPAAIAKIVGELQAPHRPGKVGRDGIEHEKTDYKLYQIYKAILFPPNSQAQLRRMHMEDTSTLWFGRTGLPDDEENLC